LGISVNRVSAFSWIAGSVLAGIAGLLVAESRQTLDISLLSTGFLVRGLAAALVGGLTSLPGAIVGGIVVGVSESILSDLFQAQGVAEAVFFGLVLVILIFRPGGLFGAREETEDTVAFIPTLRQLPVRLQGSLADKGTRWLGIVIALELSLFSLVTGPKTNDILVDMVVFAMVGVSLTVLMGYTGQISLGHWGLVGVGAFAMAGLYTRVGVPYLIALPLTVLIGMVVSLMIGLPALRIRGLYLAVATLAFNLAAEFFIFRSNFVGGGSAGVRLDAPRLGPFDLDSPTNRPLFFFALLMLILVIVVARNLGNSRTGRGFFGLRENEKAAATFGVGLTWYKLVAFAVSGGMAALAGAIYATGIGSVQSRQFNTALSLTLVAMVMIGGLGSINGAILGAFVVFALPDLVEFENEWIVPIGTGILLIVVLTRARGGVAGLLQSARGRAVDELDAIGGSPLQEPEPAPATSTAGG
ncbi:MAG: ABC transporter permease subunit, partial [Acidimicrobiales bacterium]